MSDSDQIELEGIVESICKDKFVVTMDNGEGGNFTIVATVSGRIRISNIRILPGDRVKCIISPYDLTKGRIVFRMKNS